MLQDLGLDRISIISFGHTRYIITAIHEVIRSFKLKNIEVKHIGISPDLWYGPDAPHSSQAYQSFNYAFKFLPRISNVEKRYWSTTNIDKELNFSLGSIVDFINSLLRESNPDVFLIGDDCGIIETFIMEYLNWKRIPIVFMEHGQTISNVKLEDNNRFKDKKPQDWKKRNYHLPKVKPSGLNAEYLICSYSMPSRHMMIEYGVKPSSIRGTGFPYFDRISREKFNSAVKRVNYKRRLLIISNGKGTFGALHRESATLVYKFLIIMIRNLKNDYDIYLRLKPGEFLESFLEPTMVQQLNDLDIGYDDNTLDSYEAIQKYDLVIGEMSTVLLESLILGIPTVLISLKDDPLQHKQNDIQHFVQHVIEVLTISDASKIKAIVKNAFSKEHLKRCRERIKKNQDYFFQFDGRMSDRVTQVIIEAIVRRLMAEKKFSQAYRILIDGNQKFPNSVELLILQARLRIELQNLKKPTIKIQNDALVLESEEAISRIKIQLLGRKFGSDSNVQKLTAQKNPDSLEELNATAKFKLDSGIIQQAKNCCITKASIIIPTYNRARFLSAAIQSFVKQDFPASQYEILIVDNGSTDNTKQVAEAAKSHNQAHNIRYIFEPEPGLLSGRHRGALRAKGEVLIFVDDDIEATPHWLSAIIYAFKDEFVHLIGGPSLPKFEVDPPDWISKYWTMRNDRMICGSLSLFHPGDEKIEIDPTYVWGLNYAIRKKSFFDLGGFHPDCISKDLQHFQGDGETGLSLKLKEKGFKAVYNPGAKVYHHIPRERLTVEYFEGRFYYQGVCDSYTQIRRNRGLSNIKIPQYKADDQIFFAISSPEHDVQAIDHRIQKAYIDGFIFHQDAVKKSKLVLDWVLKEDYFDYRLPVSKGHKIDRIENQCLSQQYSGKGKGPEKANSPNPTTINKLDILRDNPNDARQSFFDHTMAPLKHQGYFTSLKDQLIRLDIAVDQEDIDLVDFEKWLQINSEIKKFYLSYGDVIIEKCLEHYLAYRYLAIDQKDVYIDVAAAGSPWAEILNKRNIHSYRLDKVYPPGINGVDIGADACDTKLPDKICSALTLHCAFECFMGDADTKFLKEAGRILSENGRMAIVPLYLEDTFFVVTSPLCDQKEIIIDEGAFKVWRDDQYAEPFSRHYSPVSLLNRVYEKVPPDMTAKVIFFKNLDEVMKKYPGQRVYCYFMFICEKNADLRVQKNESKSYRTNF